VSNTVEPAFSGHTVPGRYAARSSDVTASRVLGGEQSNTSIVCGVADLGPVIVKVFRTLSPGANPDVVLQPALAAAGCEHVPTTLGWVSGQWADGQEEGHLAFAQEFLAGTQDAWRVALHRRGRRLGLRRGAARWARPRHRSTAPSPRCWAARRRAPSRPPRSW
jgi:1,4-alpha-glucan branching enzyme